MSYKIAAAVDPAMIEAFQRAGIRDTETLFQRAACVKARAALAVRLCMNPAAILQSVTVSDLLRVRRLGPDYIRLLHFAGVRTVRELRYRNAHKLLQELVEVNALRGVVRILPGLAQVQYWIAQSKELPIKISYR